MRRDRHPWWWVTRTTRQAWLLGGLLLAVAGWQLVPYALSVRGQGWGRWWLSLVLGLGMLLMAVVYLGSAVARARAQRKSR